MNLPELAQLLAALSVSGYRERFPEAALVFSARLKPSCMSSEQYEAAYDSVPALTDEFPLEGRQTTLDETWAERPSLRELLGAAKRTGPQSVVLFLDSLRGKGGSFFENAVFVGRSQESDVRLHLRTVSTSHAMLTRSKTGWIVRDLESTNGTYVDAEEIGKDPAPLESGSWVSFGPEVHSLFLSPTALFDLVSKLGASAS